MKRNCYCILMVLFILAACVPPQEVDHAATATQETTATTEPTSTWTPEPTLTPLPAPTETLPAMPENVHDLTVYNYETKKDEIINPTFDKDMNTWVWKNTSGEIRRFLDLETGHVFAQTESVKQQIIYHVDLGFGWEADLTNIDKIPDNFNKTGLQYIWEMGNNYPDKVNLSNYDMRLILKIVHGSYNEITDKSKVSFSLNNGTIMGENFFWPIYDQKNNTYILKEYLATDWVLVKDPIRAYTQGLLNWCPTVNPPEEVLILPVSAIVPKKPIQ